MEKQLCPDMNYCGVPLPDDVAAMKHAGFFDDCRAAIANYLSGPTACASGWSWS